MAEKKKMSVAEILAAARKGSAAGAGSEPAQPAPSEPNQAAAAEPAAEANEAAPSETAKPKSAAAKGARPSVAEMLAMARAKGPAGAAGEPKAAAKAEPAAKKAAPAEAKTAPKPAAKAAPGAKPVRDTASILAAARGGAKAGPISKSEAAAKPVAKPAPVGKPKTPAAKKAPVKPAGFSKPVRKEEPADEDRRGFLSLLFGSALGLGFSAMTATFGLWTLGTARFMFPNVLTEPPSQFKVGPPGNFAPGQVETKFVAQFGVWVVNGEYQGQPQIYALKTVCTHLGCTPNWLEGEQKFKCPCHGSGFYKDGINFEGPAPRPLERYAIRLADDGQLQIDKSKTFQEEVGQWMNAESFVAV